jgi:subfamily B ATP-binding cassette protein HlyB/CyaB
MTNQAKIDIINKWKQNKKGTSTSMATEKGATDITEPLLACLIAVAQAFNDPDEERVRQTWDSISATDAGSRLQAMAKQLGWKIKPLTPLPGEPLQLPIPSIGRLKNGSYCVLGQQVGNMIYLFLPETGKGMLPLEEVLEQCELEFWAIFPPFRWKSLLHKYSLDWFLTVIMHYRSYFREIIFAAFFLQLFGLLTPLFTQVIIDKVVGNAGLSTLNVLGTALVVLYLFQTVMTILRTYLLTHTTNKLDVILGSRLFRHLVSLPLPYFEMRRVGETMMRIGALTSIRNFLTGSTITLFLDVVFSMLFVLVMLYYSLPLTLLTLAFLPLSLLQNIVATPLYKKRIEAVWAAGAENSCFMVESVTGMSTVKSMSIEPQFKDRWEQLVGKNLNENFRTATFQLGLGSMSSLVKTFTSMAIFWFGGNMVMRGDMTLGQLIAFQMLSGQFSGPIMNLMSAWQTVQQSGLAMERMGDILHRQQEPVLLPVRQKLPIIRGEVRLENLVFRYRPDLEPVLRGISCTIPAGSRVGIVGRSGSGKSTLAKLLQRLYAPEQGELYIDDIPTSNVEPQWLRRQIGVVMQDNYLFNGSIRDNIAITRSSALMDEVFTAAKLAGAHEFILELPEGYDTKTGERGAALSGGQRQRIAIARALLNNPRILIFDEATSALDYESERILMENLDSICQGRTVFFIAHRLSTVRRSDLILVMDKGQVVETGTHNELIGAAGLYAHLYQQQEGLR